MKAMYNCVADNPDELTFSEGEVIVVDGEEDQEWWVSISRAGGDVCASQMFADQSTQSPKKRVVVDVGVLGNHGGFKNP